LRGWIAHAEDVPLDDEAAEALSLFIIRFPLRADLRLAVVAAPLSVTAQAILASTVSPRRTIELSWRDPVPVSDREEVLAFEDHVAPEWLREDFQRGSDQGRFQTDGLELTVTRDLTAQWVVRLEIEAMGASDVPLVEDVRIGPFAARRVEEPHAGHEVWRIDLPALPTHSARKELLRMPTVLNLRDGRRVSIGGAA
jgi:hypothetical protein